MTAYLGVDPGLRHTGLAAVYPGREAALHQIDAKGDVLTSLRQIRAEFREWVRLSEPAHNVRIAWGVERQLPAANVNGWLLAAVQLAIWDEIWAACERRREPVAMVAPYPGQLTAYIRKEHGVDVTADRNVRGAAARFTGPGRAPSIHRADALFAALMARDVLAGDYRYKQKNVAPRLAPWAFKYGRRN